MSTDPVPQKSPASRKSGRGIGPAIITASVVLGPGSILSASQVGRTNGYTMVWVLATAALLMLAMTALSARLGVLLDETPCEEIARRIGRPWAALTGLTIFLICACFQFSNNLGVLAAIEPFYEPESQWIPIAAIVGMNVFVMIALFGFKALYRPTELLMKVLIGLMVLGFAANLLMARPDLLAILAGLVPSLPEGVSETLLPKWEPARLVDGEVVGGKVIDRFGPLTALFGTTFSVAGAFYQAYLVRKKGWDKSDLRAGFVDSAVGIGTLGLITLMVMATAAAVLHGNQSVGELNSLNDVAGALEPLFGKSAVILFCLGIFAGAFSSFLVNAMIGGSMLADGIGLGGDMDRLGPKLLTALALGVGMAVAVTIHWTGQRPATLIIFAQALTVLGLPILAAVLLWLATRRDVAERGGVPMWIKLLATAGLVISLIVAVRMAASIYLRISHQNDPPPATAPAEAGVGIPSATSDNREE